MRVWKLAKDVKNISFTSSEKKKIKLAFTQSSLRGEKRPSLYSRRPVYSILSLVENQFPSPI